MYWIVLVLRFTFTMALSLALQTITSSCTLQSLLLLFFFGGGGGGGYTGSEEFPVTHTLLTLQNEKKTMKNTFTLCKFKYYTGKLCTHSHPKNAAVEENIIPPYFSVSP